MAAKPQWPYEIGILGVAYWFVTIFFCIVSSLTSLLPNFIFDLPSLAKSLSFIPYYDPNGQIWPLIVPGWSLNFEVFFYLIFAAALAFLPDKYVVPLIMLALVVLGQYIELHNPFWKTYTNPLLLEFGFGILASVFAKSISADRATKLGLVLFPVGILAVIANIWLPSPNGLMRLVYWGLPALAIVVGAVFLEKGFGEMGAVFRPLERLGDASYSLYLWHGAVIGFFHKRLGMNIFGDLTAIVVSIIAAFVSYYLIERLSAKYLQRWLLLPRVK